MVGRVGPLHALAVLVTGRRSEVIAVFRDTVGWRSLLLLRALLGRRRKLVVLHFIAHPPRTTGLGAAVDRLWAPLDRWATRRAVLRAQVLGRAERELYAATFGVEPERFCFIPFAWRMNQTLPATLASQRELVVSAGRAMCDWPTLFAAAHGRPWPLVVVCGGHDRELVDRLNDDQRASVMCEVSPAQNTELFLKAAICVVALDDSAISHGHIRLCNAVDSGAAVVATDVRALEGYVEDGVSALVVPPGDHEALRTAIDTLATDLELRDRLAAAAFERAADWTAARYLAAIESFVASGEPPSLPPGQSTSVR